MYRSDNGDHGDWRVSLQTGGSGDTAARQSGLPDWQPRTTLNWTNKLGQLLLELEKNLHEDFTITEKALVGTF